MRRLYEFKLLRHSVIYIVIRDRGRISNPSQEKVTYRSICRDVRINIKIFSFLTLKLFFDIPTNVNSEIFIKIYVYCNLYIYIRIRNHDIPSQFHTYSSLSCYNDGQNNIQYHGKRTESVALCSRLGHHPNRVPGSR